MPVPLDPRMWGKSQGLNVPHPLICHLLDTAAVATLIWDDLLTPRQRQIVLDAMDLMAEQARDVVAFWAGLHDIAKITVPFQIHVKGPKGRREELLADTTYAFEEVAAAYDLQGHEAAALWSLTGLLVEAGYPSVGTVPRVSLAHMLAQMLAGHGGRFPAALKPQHVRRSAAAFHAGLGYEGWAEQRRAHFEEVRRVVGTPLVPRGLTTEAAVILTGMVMLADWLASMDGDEKDLAARVPGRGWRGSPDELDVYWRQVASPAAREMIERTGISGTRFVKPVAPASPASPAQAAWFGLSEDLPPLVEAHGPGLVVVADQAGPARTEATFHAASVLGHAAGAHGFFYALPTGAAADSRLLAVRAFAERAMAGPTKAMLLHSSSRLVPSGAAQYVSGVWLGDDPGEETWAPEANEWLRERKKGLLAPVGVGTVHEILRAVAQLSHNAMHLFALSRKVVVIEEAHACGSWGIPLMRRFLEWAGALRIPVVLATSVPGRELDTLLSAYRRGAHGPTADDVRVPMPGWAYVTQDTAVVQEVTAGHPRTLRIEPRDGDVETTVLDTVRPIVRAGQGTVVIFRSTVDDALATHQHLSNAYAELAEGDTLLLLHPQLANRDRWRRTAGITRRLGDGKALPYPLTVLVTTPMLEHAPRLHADLLLTDPCPLTELVARAGHLAEARRDGTPVPPRLVVLDDGTPQDHHDEGLLRRTARALATGRTLRVPHELREVYDDCLSDPGRPDSDGGSLRDLDRKRLVRQQRAAETVRHAAIRAPSDIGSDLSALTLCRNDDLDDILERSLGEDLKQVLCLFHKLEWPHGEEKSPVRAFYLDPEYAVKVASDKKRWKTQQLIPYLIPFPRHLVDDVECQVNFKWRNTSALSSVVALLMTVEHGEGVCTWRDRRFRLGRNGLVAEYPDEGP